VNYQIEGRSPSDVERMLSELLGKESDTVELFADNASSQLTVVGPASVQKLAAQLIDQLNKSAPKSTAKSPSAELRSYSMAESPDETDLRDIRRSLGREARVSVDSDNGLLLVYATKEDHQIISQLLESEHGTEPPAKRDDQNDQVEVKDAESLFPQRGLQSSAQKSSSRTTSQTDTFPSSDAWVSESERVAKTKGSAVTRQQDRSKASRATEDLLAIELKHISVPQAESALQRTLGRRLVPLDAHRFEYHGSFRQRVELQFVTRGSICQLSGSPELLEQFSAMLHHLDDSRNDANADTIRVIPLSNVDPETLNRAIRLWKNAADTRPLLQGPAADEQDQMDGHGRTNKQPSAIRRATFQQADDSLPTLQSDDDTSTQKSAAKQNGTTQDEPTPLRRPSSDVTVEPLRDLDVLILRGRDPDVEELTRIIQEIERLSEETAPEIEIVYLQHVQGEAMEELISDVLTDLTGPLQGRVSITPLVKPNALLLIGWGEAVNAAKKLIAKLDETVEPQTQMQMFALKHAPATQLAETVEEFLNGRGGLGPEINVTADSRTNTLIVNAAPRDLAEVKQLIEKLDSSKSDSVNQARIIQLKNALATDVSQTITQTLTAARGGTGATRSAALEMLMAGPDGKSIVASGTLEDVKLTPDARTNRIFITGPPETVPLIEHLIQTLDETPAASAQIKVFQVTNGDATDLVQVLRSLFPEQAATSTVPQLATAEGETSLIPVRFSVDVRTNSIIATGTAGDLRIVEVLLMRLDESDSQERVNQVYRLKNSPALDVANAVNNFLRSERVVNQAAPGRQNPFAQIESEVVVVPEPVGNALIISATPRYFEQIMELVEGLDAQPPQVMIQVILAEVELDNLHEFGVELGLQDSLLFDRSLLGSILTPGYNFNNQPLGNANTAQSLATRGKVGGQALSHFSVGRTNADTDFGGLVLSASSENVSVLLRAMNQSRNMEILSRPQIMTLDNQPAFIQVGQRVPRIVGTSINQVGQVNSVELENVGLILGVTPRISPEGMVVMEIDAEKSDVGPEIDGIPVSVSADGSVIRSPRVNITTAQTTVSSASGQTIVIGGLITSSNTTTSRRVPYLSEVPLLGNLFRFDSNANNRKELLIILTPHVVRGESEAEYIKQVEMARMSWISCDVFNWMNTDMAVTGTMDSETVPTVYPDETPGYSAMQQSLGDMSNTRSVARRSSAESNSAEDIAFKRANADSEWDEIVGDHEEPDNGRGIVPANFVDEPAPQQRSAAKSGDSEMPTRVVVPKWKFQRLDGSGSSDINKTESGGQSSDEDESKEVDQPKSSRQKNSSFDQKKDTKTSGKDGTGSKKRRRILAF
jgi:general secretion pathway protein D